MRPALILVVAMAAAAACTSGASNPPSGTRSPDGPGGTKPAAFFDPPRKFDAKPVNVGPVLADLSYLDQGRVFLVRRSSGAGLGRDLSRAAVDVVDVSTSAVTTVGEFDAVPTEAHQFLFTKLAGAPTMFVAYRHVVEGTGTAVDTTVLRVRRYSLTNATAAWSVDLPATNIPSMRHVEVVAANDDHLVISAREREGPGAEISRDSTGIVLDAGNGSVRWIRDRFIPYALAKDVVAGTTPKPDRSDNPNTVHALNARTAAVVWTFTDVDIDRNFAFGFAVGADLVQINTHNRKFFSGGIATAHLVDMASGRTVLKLDRNTNMNEPAYVCIHDGGTLIICHKGNVDRAIIGVDATRHKQLWAFDQNTPGRNVPEVIAARLGVVYVDVAATLDGRTGEDLDIEMPFVPELVGPGYVLTYVDRVRNLEMKLYRATG